MDSSSILKIIVGTERLGIDDLHASDRVAVLEAALKQAGPGLKYISAFRPISEIVRRLRSRTVRTPSIECADPLTERTKLLGLGTFERVGNPQRFEWFQWHVTEQGSFVAMRALADRDSSNVGDEYTAVNFRPCSRAEIEAGMTAYQLRFGLENLQRALAISRDKATERLEKLERGFQSIHGIRQRLS